MLTAARLDDMLLAEVTALWRDVLALPYGSLQPDTHFLALGGDSLQLARLLALVETRFGVRLPLHALASFATPRRMADCCARASAGQSVEAATTVDVSAADGALPDTVWATAVQQGIWLAEQLAAPVQLHAAAVHLVLTGSLDEHVLQQAWLALLQSHPQMTASLQFSTQSRRLQLQLPPEAPQSRQALHSLAPVPGQELEELLLQACREPLDLQQGPLCRLHLFRQSPTEHHLLLRCHHIVSDGWSGGQLLAQLAAFYSALLRGAPPPASRDTSFLRYCRRVRGEEQAALQQHLSWWRDRLDPFAGNQQWMWREKPADAWPHAVRSRRFTLPTALLEAARTRGQHLQHSLFTLLLLAVRAGLYRYSGEADLVLALPMAQRRPDEERSVGCFIDVVLLAATLQPQAPVLALQETATLVADSLQRRVPLALLAGSLRPRVLPDGNAWTSILFAFQNYPVPAAQWEGLQQRVRAMHCSHSQHALKLEVVSDAAGWTLHIEYATALFDAGGIELLAAAITGALQDIVSG